jgi:hypothetical protein
LINDAKVRIKSLIKEGKKAASAVFLRKVVSSYKSNLDKKRFKGISPEK